MNAETETENQGAEDEGAEHPSESEQRPRELGGPKGPEPTRYGDWEHKGRCSDF